VKTLLYNSTILSSETSLDLASSGSFQVEPATVPCIIYSILVMSVINSGPFRLLERLST
jgi:hypothetical protein